MIAGAMRRLDTWTLPHYTSGALTALKLLGLALMVVDHLDAFVFDRSLFWAGALGRLVFPIFAVVFGYNLARDSLDAAGRSRLLVRLLAFGLLAWPVHAALTGGGEGNILLTFAAAVVVLQLHDAGDKRLACLVFLAAGAVVEYNWPGIGLVLAIRALYRQPDGIRRALVLWCWTALAIPNGSMLALLALPVVFYAARFDPKLPRLQGLFYVAYPAHLAAFWLLTRTA